MKNLKTIIVCSAFSLLLSHHLMAQEACGDLACDLGSQCESTQGASPRLYCELSQCETDSDCAAYLSCAPRSVRVCPDGFESSCLEGETDSQCVARTREGCTREEHLHCKPRWNQPCETAEDCGDGFECEASSCIINSDQDCDVDADCREFWQCGRFMTGPCGVSTGMTEEECEQAVSRRCVPPSWGVRQGDQVFTNETTTSSTDEVSPTVAEATTEASPVVKEGACSVSLPGARGTGLTWGLGALLGLLLGMRSRRALRSGRKRA